MLLFLFYFYSSYQLLIFLLFVSYSYFIWTSIFFLFGIAFIFVLFVQNFIRLLSSFFKFNILVFSQNIYTLQNLNLLSATNGKILRRHMIANVLIQEKFFTLLIHFCSSWFSLTSSILFFWRRGSLYIYIFLFRITLFFFLTLQDCSLTLILFLFGGREGSIYFA